MSRSSEQARLGLLREVFGALPPPELGVGDDAAVLYDPRPLVATVDAAVEGVHFRRDLLSLADASARACEAAMSDVAAMGGTLQGPGCGLLLAWTLPPTLSDDDLLALAHGAQRAAARVGARIVGGNLARGSEITLTTTVLGRCDGDPLRRDGARPGDVVAVSGPLGLAATGLRALLASNEEPWMQAAVARWRRPVARLDLGAALRGRAHACIDVSDGLALDARRLADASRVRLSLDLDALHRLAAATGTPVDDEAMLHGGEDYELLAAGPREAFDSHWTIVGEACDGAGVTADIDGRELAPRGWDHFSAT